MAEASTTVTPFKTPRTKQERQWLTHLLRCTESGLSLAAYARSQGLVVNTFYGWHRRLKQRELAQPEPVARVFHRVTVKSAEPSAAVQDSAATLRFQLPNGISCEVAGIKPDGCASFLETLARLRI